MKQNIKKNIKKKKSKNIKLPLCDGTNFPFIKQCSKNASNNSTADKNGNPKQCIINKPGISSLKPGSIYTCGFLW